MTAPAEPSDDCPLCGSILDTADHLFPLHCPNQCSFACCQACIRGMYDAQAGPIKCPNCRSTYGTTTATTSTIVAAVLCLRRCYDLWMLAQQADCDLTATELANQDAWRKQLNASTIRSAYASLQAQHRTRGWSPLPDMPWDMAVLLRRQQSFDDDTDASAEDSLWIDPTLMVGLHELMSREELEFCTQLLVSGKSECLAQAALILNGILQVTPTADVLQSTMDLDRIRKKYPLPRHMPRTVRLAMYDPLQKGAPLKFKKTSLELVSVRGEAGQAGLRKGDIVSHAEGEPVATLEDFYRALQDAADGTTLLVTVNATENIARELKERAQTMKDDNIHFYD